MRWLTTPLQHDDDVVAASSRLRAWVDALGLDDVARARVVTLGGELVRVAASSGQGAFELGWKVEGGEPWCAVEAPARVLEAAVKEMDDHGSPRVGLEVVRSRLGDRLRVRIEVRARADHAAVERAVARAADASAVDVLRAQNLEMARMLGTLRDREADLAHAIDELEAVSREKDELLAVASHDIRSPLAAAKGALDLLEPTLANLTDDQKHLLGVARRGCDAVVHLVGNLMTAALVEMPEDGGDDADNGTFDLAATIRDVIDLTTVLARQKGVDVRVESPASVSPVRGDPVWARQIVSNLVSNALKYAPKTSGRIDVRVEERGGEVTLVVDDNGVGIPREQIDRVFEKLVRLKPRGTAGERGTGIGLYVTKTLVERLGGRIAAIARDGGARFEVRLPIADSDRRVVATTRNAQRL
jgi:signal transduction histidine kinase